MAAVVAVLIMDLIFSWQVAGETSQSPPTDRE
jgi:hypothetical protein